MQHPFDNLSRDELLALAKQQQAELDALRAGVMCMEDAGSIADAALEISGVFQASQRAANIYLKSVEAMKSKREAEYFLRLAEAEQQAQQMLLETQEQCSAAVTRAQESARFYWTEMHRKLDEIFGADPDLVRLLRQLPTGKTAEDDGFGPDD